MKLFESNHIKILIFCFAFLPNLQTTAFADNVCKREQSAIKSAESSLRRADGSLQATGRQLARINSKLEKATLKTENILEKIENLQADLLELEEGCPTLFSRSKCKQIKKIQAKVAASNKKKASSQKTAQRHNGTAQKLNQKNETNLQLVEKAQILLDAANANYIKCTQPSTISKRTYSYNFSATAPSAEDLASNNFENDFLKFDLSPVRIYLNSRPSDSPIKASVNPYSTFSKGLSTVDIGLQLSNMNIKIQTVTSECATKISFDYAIAKGKVNLSINKLSKSVASLSELNEKKVGTGLLLQTENSNFDGNQSLLDSGHLEITGNCLKELIIGGESLLIDNVIFETLETE